MQTKTWRVNTSDQEVLPIDLRISAFEIPIWCPTVSDQQVALNYLDTADEPDLLALVREMHDAVASSIAGGETQEDRAWLDRVEKLMADLAP